MNFNLSKNIILENKRVKLEQLGQHHLEDLIAIAIQQPRLLQYSPSPFGDKNKLIAYLNIAEQNLAEGTRYAFAIFDKTQKRYVGSTSFGNISNKNQRLEIGWTWLDKAVQGTGLNKNNKFLMLQFAFEKLQFERVELKTDSRNLQSRKAIEKIGAIYEGELRSHTLMNDGHRRNTVYYSILKAEWEGVKNTIFKDLQEE